MALTVECDAGPEAVVEGHLAAAVAVFELRRQRDAVKDSVPKGTESFNLKAFDLGFEYGKELG